MHGMQLCKDTSHAAMHVIGLRLYIYIYAYGSMRVSLCFVAGNAFDAHHIFFLVKFFVDDMCYLQYSFNTSIYVYRSGICIQHTNASNYNVSNTSCLSLIHI